MKNIIYKTYNFRKLRTWIFRIMLILGILVFIVVRVSMATNKTISLTEIGIVVGVIILFVAMSQVEELTIDENQLIIEQKSFIPALSSKKSYTISEIKALKSVANQTTNDRGFFLFRNNKSILELELLNGEFVRLRGALHPKGVEGLKSIFNQLL